MPAAALVTRGEATGVFQVEGETPRARFVPALTLALGGIVTVFAANMRRRMLADKRDVIVLIHGFANTFVNSLQRAAQI